MQILFNGTLYSQSYIRFVIDDSNLKLSILSGRDIYLPISNIQKTDTSGEREEKQGTSWF